MPDLEAAKIVLSFSTSSAVLVTKTDPAFTDAKQQSQNLFWDTSTSELHGALEDLVNDLNRMNRHAHEDIEYLMSASNQISHEIKFYSLDPRYDAKSWDNWIPFTVARLLLVLNHRGFMNQLQRGLARAMARLSSARKSVFAIRVELIRFDYTIRPILGDEARTDVVLVDGIDPESIWDRAFKAHWIGCFPITVTPQLYNASKIAEIHRRETLRLVESIEYAYLITNGISTDLNTLQSRIRNFRDTAEDRCWLRWLADDEDFQKRMDMMDQQLCNFLTALPMRQHRIMRPFSVIRCSKIVSGSAEGHEALLSYGIPLLECSTVPITCF